ncbi:hypothetical protein [Candidatus Nitrosocaldus islandicus]|uniref:hypothetical protein n=1 Tax=Candidatus Nitrosocaldus islandicus TaxID=2045011 RepID=UPI000CD14B19|nr:hypothetical protein [Candidatus Nitrosocaldus islandicus]
MLDEMIKRECSRYGISFNDLLSLLLKRIEKVGIEEFYKEIKALSELDSKRSYFLEQIKIRDWIERNIPRDKYVFTDIDYLAVTFDSALRDKGVFSDRFMLLEFKYGNRPFRLGFAQMKSFDALDKVLRTSRLSEHYLGFYVITLDDMNIDNAEKIYINNKIVNKEELKRFLMFNGDY